MYCWWRDDQLIWVDAAEDLRRRIVAEELTPGVKPVPRFRKFVGRRGQAEGVVERGGRQRRRRAQIDEYIRACEVAWVETETLEDAEDLAAPIAESLETTTPNEIELLNAYLTSFEPMGEVFREVPIGSSEGRPPRRIDAVRFPGRTDHDHNGYDRAAFEAALTASAASGTIEVIEVKVRLNRPVFGQAVIARELAIEEWELGPEVRLELVALVGLTDPVLEPIFGRHGIRVIEQN